MGFHSVGNAEGLPEWPSFLPFPKLQDSSTAAYSSPWRRRPRQWPLQGSSPQLHSVAHGWQQSYVSGRSNYLKLVVEQKEACLQVNPVGRIKLTEVLTVEIITISFPTPHLTRRKWLKVTIIQVWKVENAFLEKYFMFSIKGMALNCQRSTNTSLMFFHRT